MGEFIAALILAIGAALAILAFAGVVNLDERLTAVEAQLAEQAP